MKKFRFLVLMVVMLALMCAVCACAQSSQNPTEQPDATTQKPTDAPTTPTQTTPVDDGKVTYTVKIVDEAGNPIANVLVQLCKDSCVPNKTNENGIAEYRLVEDDYKASIMSMPEGYAHVSEQTEFYFEDGSYEVTITLKAA